MSRIQEKFGELKRAGRGGFIPFITAGDPDLATTERLLIELAKAGADIIELGVPFSDPVADGEVIQRASERALRNGVTVHDALTCAKNVRQHIDVPIVLFSYFNPLLQFGPEPFAAGSERGGDRRCACDGSDSRGSRVVDSEPASTSTRSDLLVAPTTSDKRLARIAQQAHGFIYAVSRAGVTGARNEMTRDAEALVKRARAVSDLPVAVGFGISTPEQVRSVWRFADAAVVGSAIVREIENLRDSSDLVKRVGEFAPIAGRTRPLAIRNAARRIEDILGVLSALGLFRSYDFLAMDNLRQAAERAVYCFRIRKNLRYIGLQHYNVAAFWVTPRVLATLRRKKRTQSR